MNMQNSKHGHKLRNTTAISPCLKEVAIGSVNADCVPRIDPPARGNAGERKCIYQEQLT